MSKQHPSRHVPERFLRQLWKHREFNIPLLQTTDGRRLEIISPGTLNPDGGPDFRNALIRIGGTLFRGDIELHGNDDDWRRHLHHQDPKYNGVILHVVLEARRSIAPPATASGRVIPVLALAQSFTVPYHTVWHTMIERERSERTSLLRCYKFNAGVEAATLRSFLSKLAVERIEIKIRRFEERLKELIDEERLAVQEPIWRQRSGEPSAQYNEIPFGVHSDELPPPGYSYTQRDFARPIVWEQLLYEGVMESLGYSKNQKPFLRLARCVTLRFVDEILAERPAGTDQRMKIESMLFHVSGLVPKRKDIICREGKLHARALNKEWRTLRATYRREHLHAADWQFFRLRPENFPTVRLAGAARLIERFREQRMLKSIIRIIKQTETNGNTAFHELENLFVVPADGFWSRHYRFEEPAQVKLTALIGAGRSRDILLNVVLPICLLYARHFRDKEVRQGALKMFDRCPRTVADSVNRIISGQLLRKRFELVSARLQQGALQLYKCYCLHGRCTECAIGKIVFPVQIGEVQHF